MTDYNDGNWHGWNRNCMPVHAQTIVDMTWDVGDRDANRDTRPANAFDWSCKVIAFRVVKEHREPRELWVRWNPAVPQWVQCGASNNGAVLFREVLE